MKLIICLDDKYGMAFFGKRQSMDQAVCRDILALSEGHKLWMKEYSAKLFSGVDAMLCIDECYLLKAGKNDYCFAETDDVNDIAYDAEQIIVYKWNRAYPSDLRFSAELLQTREKVASVDFSGSSHDKITREVYR